MPTRSRCCACCAGGAPTGLAEDRHALDEPRARGRGVATPIVSARTSSSAASSRSHRVGTTAGVDLALERAAQRARDRDRRGHARRAARIARTRSTASSSDALPLRWLNALCRGERAVDAVELRVREALVAALVEHEPGELRIAAARRLRPLPPRPPSAARARRARTRPPRCAARAPPRAARRARRARPRREGVRLVLQAVARADVADRDVHRYAGAATGDGASSTVSRGAPAAGRRRAT